MSTLDASPFYCLQALPATVCSTQEEVPLPRVPPPDSVLAEHSATSQQQLQLRARPLPASAKSSRARTMEIAKALPTLMYAPYYTAIPFPWTARNGHAFRASVVLLSRLELASAAQITHIARRRTNATHWESVLACRSTSGVTRVTHVTPRCAKWPLPPVWEPLHSVRHHRLHDSQWRVKIVG